MSSTEQEAPDTGTQLDTKATEAVRESWRGGMVVRKSVWWKIKKFERYGYEKLAGCEAAHKRSSGLHSTSVGTLRGEDEAGEKNT